MLLATVPAICCRVIARQTQQRPFTRAVGCFSSQNGTSALALGPQLIRMILVFSVGYHRPYSHHLCVVSDGLVLEIVFQAAN